MKKANRFFWISFAIYMLVSFTGALVIERNQNNLGFLINMKGYIPLLKYYTFTGLVLFIIAFVLWWRTKARKNREIAQLSQDKKELKAKMFDLQDKKGESSPVIEEKGLSETMED